MKLLLTLCMLRNIVSRRHCALIRHYHS